MVAVELLFLISTRTLERTIAHIISSASEREPLKSKVVCLATAALSRDDPCNRIDPSEQEVGLVIGLKLSWDNTYNSLGVDRHGSSDSRL